MAYWPESKRRPLHEWIGIGAFVLGLGLCLLIFLAYLNNCGHGKHEGVCARQFKSGKFRTLKTCECAKDHY